jgi:hypothetical protein
MEEVRSLSGWVIVCAETLSSEMKDASARTDNGSRTCTGTVQGKSRVATVERAARQFSASLIQRASVVVIVEAFDRKLL